MRSSPVSRDWGFSLLELMVVLVLVAMVSTSVVVRWSGVQQGATLESAITQLEFLDAQLRRYAQAHGTPCSLAFDLQKHRLRKQYHDQQQKNPAWLALGRNIQLKDLTSPATGQRGNKVEVQFLRDGTSATYGVELSGPGEQQAWLVFAGISGQLTRLESEGEYQDALQLLSPKQP